MATSGTYNFLSITSQQVIDEAYERIGIVPDIVTLQQIITAQRSANLVLQEWINKGYNLWTSTRTLLPINTNQANYTLPIQYSDVVDVNVRTFQRPLGGTAFSSAGGNPDNVFGGNGNCTQNAPNGYISYNYGNNTAYEVTMVGVLSAANLNYTLAYEYSLDGINWISALTSPLTAFTTTTINWIDMLTPANAQYFRIRETGGATLNITQLYFTNSVIDNVMARISSSEYMTYPDKTVSGRPSVFWMDRQVNPVLVLWPTPSSQYMVLSMRVIRMLQDLGSMTNNIEIPSRFQDAYCAALAKRLAIKKVPRDQLLIDSLEKDEEKAYSYAATEDTEKVPLRLIPSYLTGWSLQ